METIQKAIAAHEAELDALMKSVFMLGSELGEEPSPLFGQVSRRDVGYPSLCVALKFVEKNYCDKLARLVVDTWIYRYDGHQNVQGTNVNGCTVDGFVSQCAAAGTADEIRRRLLAHGREFLKRLNEEHKIRILNNLFVFAKYDSIAYGRYHMIPERSLIDFCRYVDAGDEVLMSLCREYITHWPRRSFRLMRHLHSATCNEDVFRTTQEKLRNADTVESFIRIVDGIHHSICSERFSEAQLDEVVGLLVSLIKRIAENETSTDADRSRECSE